MRLWIDIINPSDSHFFDSVLNSLYGLDYFITVRDRAETIELLKSCGFDAQIIGKDYDGKAKKSLNMIYRTIQLAIGVPRFDCCLAFENGMASLVSKTRNKCCVQFCDNDLKFYQAKSFLQNVETSIKGKSNYLIVPQVCYENFKNFMKHSNVITYDGYKEDIYLADYKPDNKFLDNLPFSKYIVLRPEALGSFYVTQDRSIVPDILRSCKEQDLNVLYLPRETKDRKLAQDFDVFIPNRALNGLDMCYYAEAVLTGSGTLAREAACMGKKSVSFFPSNYLLSVDRDLIKKGKLLHSRNTGEIMDYVLNPSNNSKINIEGSGRVKEELLRKLNIILKTIPV